jgi:hypothetical protein
MASRVRLADWSGSGSEDLTWARKGRLDVDTGLEIGDQREVQSGTGREEFGDLEPSPTEPTSSRPGRP